MERQTNRQTDRHTETDRDRHTVSDSFIPLTLFLKRRFSLWLPETSKSKRRSRINDCDDNYKNDVSGGDGIVIVLWVLAIWEDLQR